MKTSWSVTVVYEDEEKRAEAMQFCDQMVERFWARGELELSWWSFEQLGASDSTEEALRKATQADVIVFATRPESMLPPEVNVWLERWLNARGEREGRLVGLLGPGASNQPADQHLKLRKLAHRGGMDYLTGMPEYAAQPVPDSVESYQERAHCVTSVLDGILHHPQRPPHLVF